jgi:hypothetical protein
LAFLLSVDPVASVICCMLAHSVTLRRNAKAQIEFEVGRGKVRLVQIGAVAFLRSSIGSLPMLLAMRRASSIVSTFINIGERLARRVLHDISTGDTFGSPWRLEAARHYYPVDNDSQASQARCYICLDGDFPPPSWSPKRTRRSPCNKAPPRHRWGFFFVRSAYEEVGKLITLRQKARVIKKSR